MSMKNITKNSEPRSLVEHRLKDGQFADAQGEGRWKTELQEALLEEQGGICCYCMGRISEGQMKVEHFRCQDRYRERELDYRNLMAACMGGEGHPRKQQHCDTRKGNLDIEINPTGDVERVLRYLSDGTVESGDPQYADDLNEVLNLNVSKLIRSRKSTHDGLFDALVRTLGKREWRESELERELGNWRARDSSGNFRPFVQVGVYFLQKRLGLLRR
jgi:uncharacterized protein (TIGR02646 family)